MFSELGYILDGNISSGVDVEQPNLPGRAGFVQHPPLADKMHVVFFVVPCEESINPEYMNRLKALKRFCTDRGKIETSQPPMSHGHQLLWSGQRFDW